MNEVFNIIFRTLLALVFLLLCTRIMGRKTIAQLTFYDYVIGITLGSISATIAVDQSIMIRDGLISLSVATLWVLAINLITGKSLYARKLIDSEPIMVIHKGKILENNLQKKYYNINDILEQLREQGIFDPNEVEVGISESDGQLSILKKYQFQETTKKDIHLNQEGQSVNASKLVSKELIIDGKIIDRGIKASGFTLEWLQDQLKERGIKNVEDVVLALITPQGYLYIDVKKDIVDDKQCLD
jgi:uncharacterized membrane protein YcaP (DUF421 family)